MATQKFDQLIAAAVLWWASHLSEVSMEGINGDNESQESFFAFYARLILQNNGQIPDENVKRFMQLLTEHLQERSKNGGRQTLSTDYTAEWPLSDICRQAGVNSVYFPQKTTMWIDFEKQIVTWETVRGSDGQVYPLIEEKKEEFA